jgi:hypothetical protein
MIHAICDTAIRICPYDQFQTRPHPHRTNLMSQNPMASFQERHFSIPTPSVITASQNGLRSPFILASRPLGPSPPPPPQLPARPLHLPSSDRILLAISVIPLQKRSTLLLLVRFARSVLFHSRGVASGLRISVGGYLMLGSCLDKEVCGSGLG